MSQQDVDLEFEKAYQRLFGSSSTPPGDTNVGNSSGHAAHTELSRAPHHATYQRATPGPSSSRSVERQHSGRKDAALHSLLRKPSGLKAPTSARIARSSYPDNAAQRMRPPQPRSSLSGLEALVRHGPSAASKGKARAGSYIEPEDHTRNDQRSARSPAVPAAAVQHTSAPPQEGSIVYYPYPQPQAPYQVPGTVMTSMPNQAMTWTQPIMPAGPVATLTYPGFSTSITFSQPQFFAPPQPQIQPAVSPVPADGWQSASATLQPYTQQPASPSPAGARTASHHHPEQERPEPARKPKAAKKRASTSSHPYSEDDGRYTDISRSAQTEAVRKQRVSASGLESRFDEEMGEERPKPFAGLSPQTQAKMYIQSLGIRKHGGRRPKLDSVAKAESKSRKTWKPVFDQDGVRVPKKRGRPPRIAKLSPEDETPLPGALEEAVQVKTEVREVVIPAQAAAAPQSTGAFDGCLPLSESAGPPYNLETHTMFVLSARRLRWLARLAIVKAVPEAESERVGLLTLDGVATWARWSNSIAARLQGLVANPATALSVLEAMPSQSAPSSAPSQSQADPAGLFPRDSRRAYVAMRKQMHSAARTATERICIRRLLRYVTKTASRLESLQSKEGLKAYLRKKHRSAKLAKHMLRFSRPASLDARKMWIVWARAAHARAAAGKELAGRQDEERESEKEKRVSFAPSTTMDSNIAQPISPLRQDVPRIKLEPVSPSAQRVLLNSRSEMTTSQETGVQVKAEPNLEGVITPPLPGSPVLNAVTASGETVGDVEVGPKTRESGQEKRPPLFLRRNFRLYRLVGLSGLPLS